MDSFINLVRPWSSLPSMLKLSALMLCPVWMLCACMGYGSLRCSLYLSPRFLEALSVQKITELLGFCLHNTYFSFQNKFYEQVEGAQMSSPVSPIVANLYMEHFKREALWSAPNPLRYWFRYVDDTFVIQQQANKQVISGSYQQYRSSNAVHSWR